MFFSSSKKSEDSSSSAASSSSSTSSVPSSSTTTSADSSQSWTEGGGAGLGVVPSLSPECTPLKHHYDSCFDKWFTDYLSIGDAQILKQQRQSAADSQSEKGADASKKGSSWFGGAGSDSGSAWSSLTGQGDSSTDPDLERKKKEIMERYDRDCGKLFRDYQSCVKRAVAQKGLDPLIAEARRENPFPFDHQRGGNDQANNPPFPFPAARKTADE